MLLSKGRLVVFFERSKLSGEVRNDLLETFHGLDGNKLIEHHGHVPRKTSTLARNCGAGNVNRNDTTAAPVSIDGTDFQQNSRFSTGANSNFHSSVQSILNARKVHGVSKAEHATFAIVTMGLLMMMGTGCR